MTRTLGDIESNLTISLATVIDPRFKLKAIKNDDNKRLLKTILTDKMVAQLTQHDSQPQAHNTDPQPSTSNAPVAVPAQLNSNDSSAMPTFSLWNEFDLEVNVDFAPKPYREKVADELEKYLGESLIKRNECPFNWCRQEESNEPKSVSIIRP
ncbi:unnamed protein product [Euphydryas editha]|uniref:Uncharacterized protein n=1 Tax=Euphydryas editha TaxID=104508 RepID=A0AAU9TTH3_EUPED|nr:unnamed protein product [Euphydryas editha]